MSRYSNPGVVEFDAVLERSDARGSSAYVAFPHDVRELFGTGGRVPVVATFDGVPYRGSLVTYGGPHLILVLASIRESIGKEPGDTVHVTIALDEEPRLIELDEDVAAAFTAAGVTDAFRAMSYSHQREYQQWIVGAKREETRARRIAKSIELIGAGARLKG
ncbi:bacteriocin resistance YdeI/OmpD-like protein [Homoserinimonas aerilata]|uniref:Bacteriocin resistance YdeI/OmpD-like protein n=1 Tax=Homoserinimonas aerilata TaxID=1162970 RepID=A0A542YGW3_9MICO|nr:YdeI/OmpD-associated family protein [Homoserinimonas aerilata]TQL47322.1 bacteriocin resistance YdeI/OmpD-like protein [Homoserinimonas aerilata]